MSAENIENLIHTGKLNLADNGTNCQELVQAAGLTADLEKRKRYLATDKKWLDCRASIWALPDGFYGNGSCVGQQVIQSVCEELQNRHIYLDSLQFTPQKRKNWKWVISENNLSKLKQEGKNDYFKDLWDGSEKESICITSLISALFPTTGKHFRQKEFRL